MITNLKHGENRRNGGCTRLYSIWGGIIQRTTNKKNNHYQEYGGRGIKVCEEWRDSINFIKWARENGYNDKLIIDRINNNLGYNPENCRWVTHSESNVNKFKRKEWGIHKHGFQWRVVIGRNGINYHVGSFYSLNLAILKRDIFLEDLIRKGITKY